MKTPKKACFINGIENSICPNCGRPLQTVDYYTAQPLRQEEVGRNYNSRTVVTTYTNVNPHMAQICLSCAHENARGSRIAGLVLMIGGGMISMISMIAGLVRSTLAQNSGGNVGAALGLPMALMCVFVIVAIVGLCMLVGSNALVPGRKYSQDQLFHMFIKTIQKESPQYGVVFLSPMQVKQMKRS
jgi:hypothetical protein